MYKKVISGAVYGITGRMITVEADISCGFPSLTMVGYLASEVREARERVMTAVRNSGFQIPAKRIVVNLSPADIRKQGTAFDLPHRCCCDGRDGQYPEPVYVRDDDRRRTWASGECDAGQRDSARWRCWQKNPA